MIPLAMEGYKQFICWTLVDKGGKKPDKVPTDPLTGNYIDPHNAAAWMDSETAAQYAAMGYGVGFVFTKEDPFFFLDIDECLVDGQWSNTATHMCTVFAGCYVEISHSGDGLHIFGSGTYTDHGCRNTPLGMELYTSGRFCALTGVSASGDAATVMQPQIDTLIATYFPPTDQGEVGDWTTAPCDEWYGIADDDELIKKMLKSQSTAAAFGNRATIKDLWAADPAALAKHYPDPIRDFDHSSADAALLSHLAFWTGKDCERMDRLFRKSALMREKWDRKEGTFGTYGNRSVLKGCGQCTNVYGSDRKPAEQDALEPKYSGTGIGEIRDGFQYLTIDHQQTLFKGCCYVRDIHRVFTPDGALLKENQFKAMYGGYVFALDTINDKTTKSAWEAFTESQALHFPKVHGVCFRPEVPSGSIITEESRTLVNTYVPIDIVMTEGDAAPFLKHCELMLPDPRDREILISYMAACVQHKGVKFQWAPLLQGCEGNGKSLFSRVMMYAIGKRYSHTLNATDLGNKFNSWIRNKLLIVVEEVYTTDKRNTADLLKESVTNEQIEIQGKGEDQVTGDNRANFFMNSNHKDAVRKNSNDRRYCVFYTAQQDFSDMVRCGLLTPSGDSTTYFPELYDWLRGGGYAIVANYLNTYKIADLLNPATKCKHAPCTSSTDEVKRMSLGGIEQEILEAIDEKRPGFSGGWISSMALDRLLEQRRDNKKITRNKRKELLTDLGYVQHPNLHDGRVNNIIPMDGGKPRLYIKANHLLSNLRKPSEIAARYVQDQAGTVVTDVAEGNVNT